MNLVNVTQPELDSDQQLVLDAAATLFERFGYRKTTIDDISQEAGIGKGSVYLRFKSKEEIGLVWLELMFCNLFNEVTDLSRDPAPLESLRKFLVNRVMARFDLMERHFRSLDEAVDALKPQLEERKRRFHEREAEFMAALIRKSVDEGTAHSSNPVDDAQNMILASYALMPYSLRTSQLGDRKTVLDRAESLADFLLRAIQKSANP